MSPNATPDLPEAAVNLGDLLQVVLKNRLLVLLSWGLVMAITVIYTATRIPIFESTSSLLKPLASCFPFWCSAT